jgi:hypothetical protein
MDTDQPLYLVSDGTERTARKIKRYFYKCGLPEKEVERFGYTHLRYKFYYADKLGEIQARTEKPKGYKKKAL